MFLEGAVKEISDRIVTGFCGRKSAIPAPRPLRCGATTRSTIVSDCGFHRKIRNACNGQDATKNVSKADGADLHGTRHGHAPGYGTNFARTFKTDESLYDY